MVSRKDQRATLTVRSEYTGGRQIPNFISSLESRTYPYETPFKGPGAALKRTHGILFPYTPQINVAHQVEYSQYDLVHTNYQQNAYSKTRNPTIQVTGQFISQTPAEAAYTVGAMHFLRVVTKMNFGFNDRDAGTPPPVLEFSAYGAYNFQRVPVLVTDFAFNYEDGVDYVEVNTAGETVQVPSIMMLTVGLTPQYSPDRQSKFNLKNFASGAGYRGGFL